MSNNEELHNRFLKAYETSYAMENVAIPIDLRLQFYAYYKQATISNQMFYNPQDPDHIRNAFKMNALLQVKHLTSEEAKLAYIELVNQTIKNYNLDLEPV